MRQIKSELALQKRGWQDLNEKADLIAKLLDSFGVGVTPVFHSSISFQASEAGLVDILAEGDKFFTAGWDCKIVKWHVSSKTAPPVKMAEFVGHDEG